MRTFISDECFIISPIGNQTPEGLVLHDHVERVRTDIIDKSLAVVNIKRGLKLRATRSDMRAEHGSIRERFLKAIISDQLLFVILTCDVKPNVYYELGIAHSAARPVIVLSDKRLTKREFDIYDIKIIPYALGESDRSGKAQDVILPVEQVVSHIEHILDNEEDEHAFVGHNPLGKQTRNFRVHDQFQHISYKDWGMMLSRASSRIDFYGASLDELAKKHGAFQLNDGKEAKKFSLRDLLTIKMLFDGVDVTIAMLHQDNPALEALLKATDSGVDPDSLDAIKEEIESSVGKWREVVSRLATLQESDLAFSTMPVELRNTPTPAPRRGSFRVIQIRHGLGKFRMTLTDKEIIVTPFFYDPPQNSRHPAFEARKGTALYASILREHEHLLEINHEYIVASFQVGERRAG